MISPLLALAAGTLLSEDLTCIAAGLLIAKRAVSPLAAICACAMGIYAGDLGLWMCGRILGGRILQWPRIRASLPCDITDRFSSWFDRCASRTIVGSRFAPGTRLPLYLAAGACRTSFRTFAIWSAVAVAVWTPLLVVTSIMVGEAFATRIAAWIALGRVATLTVAVVALLGWQVVLRLSTRRGRQRTMAAVSRAWRWEFWPMWLFYAPVAAHTMWLALRHRGFGTIAAANPGMPDGGVVGESKFEILSRLPRDCTIPSAVLEPGIERVETLHSIMRNRAWSFPIVLKPDVGQRGTGVRLVTNLDAAAQYLDRMTSRVVVQPYHPGPFEAGLFYYRMPNWRRGRILGITDKHFPFVVGDGVSTAEDLVWSHRRYRMQANMFLSRLGNRRLIVPRAGESVRLGVAGNHAQGAMFKDGRHLMTRSLETRIDAIARHYDGFFIGRFDVRYSDPAEFMAGRDIAIVELNGATAECTNIYDPDGSLWSAYRQLFKQWSLVFAIGAANQRRGHQGSSFQRLLSLVRQHASTPSPLPVSD